MKSRPSVTTEPPSPLLAQCTVHVYIPNRFQWCWNEGIVQPNRVGYRSTCTERLSVQYMCTFQTGFNDAEMRDYMYGMWILRYPYWSTQCKAGLSLVDMLKGIWQAALTSLFWSLAELDLGSSCTRHWVPHFSLCGIDKEFSLTDWDGKNILRKYLRSIFRLY